MKNKIFGLLIGLLVFASIACAADLTVSSVNYDPSPAVPGQYLNMSINITNNSNGDAQKAVFNLNLKGSKDSEFPFTLEPGVTAMKDLGTIPARQAAVIKYKILVDPKALDGDYTIYLETGENDKIYKSTPYTIRILSQQPILTIVSSNPTQADIGKETEITLDIKNTGSSTAYDLSIGLSEERTVTATGSIVERDIIPLGTSTVYETMIGPGEVKSIRLPILINPAAEQKANFIPIKIEYYDSQKTKYSDTKYIGLKVYDPSNLGANATPSEQLYPGKTSKINLEIFNAGDGSAKFLNLKASSDFASFKQSEFYIGTLESDDYDSVSLETTVNSSIQPGNYALNVEMTFKDQYGEEKNVEKIIPITIVSQQDAIQGSQQQSPILLYALVIAVIAAAGWFFFLKKKKSK